MAALAAVVTSRNHVAVLHLDGELDIDRAPQVRALCSGLLATNQRVVVDCAGLTFLDSTGIATFLALGEEAERTGTQLRFVNVHGMPRKAIEILGVDRQLGLGTGLGVLSPSSP